MIWSELDITKDLQRFLFLSVAALCIFAPPAYAEGEPDSCDASIYTKMKNRAAAEASRDTVMAQTAIRRPDSVLEYSCFSQFASLTAVRAAPLFSESAVWQGNNVDISTYDPVHSPSAVNVALNVSQASGNLFNAIGMVAFDAMTNYGLANFGHNYLGFVDATGSGSSTASYACSAMQTVWHASKCDSFSSEDIFTKLGDGQDIRQWPAGSECTGTGYASLDIDVTPDPIITNLQRYHREAPNVQDCASQTPLATGRMVTNVKDFNIPASGAPTRDVEVFPELICVLPGCYFDYNAGQCAEE